MFKYIFLLFLLSVGKLWASTGDTTHVRFHNGQDLLCCSKGYNFRGKFPVASVSWNRIIMKYTLGCASSGCSGWDYTTHVRYLKPTGNIDSSFVRIDSLSGDSIWKTFEIIEKYELGRVITPYGTYMKNNTNGFNNGWTREYWFDVTDYAGLLQDSATLEAFYSGWSDGFKITLDFYFIEGVPPRPVIGLVNLYGKGGNSFGYTNSSEVETKHLPPLKVKHIPNTKSARIRFVPTGHGFDNSQYAAEFYPEPFTFLMDGDTIGKDIIWDNNCGKNALYPQGGTWVYNRANWCPGTKAGIYLFELNNLSNLDSHVVDLNFEPFSWSGNQTPSYTLSTEFISYGDYNYNNEASLEDIISPSKDSNYLRENPICSSPAVIIRNNGKLPLTTLKFEYGFANAIQSTYTWHGNLVFAESLRVDLPSPDYTGVQQSSIFTVKISEPNGKSDEYIYNNIRTSKALIPLKIDKTFIVWFKSNHRGSENKYTIKDWDGKTVYSKGPFGNDSIYKDTIHLTPGCFTFTLTDEVGDGIDWWANSTDAGKGYCWIRNMNNFNLRRLNPDFGSEISFRFNTEYGLGTEVTSSLPFVPILYPNPANEYINLETGVEELKGNIRIISPDGKLCNQQSFTRNTNFIVENYNSGLYTVMIILENGEVYIKRLMIVH